MERKITNKSRHVSQTAALLLVFVEPRFHPLEIYMSVLPPAVPSAFAGYASFLFVSHCSEYDISHEG